MSGMTVVQIATSAGCFTATFCDRALVKLTFPPSFAPVAESRHIHPAGTPAGLATALEDTRAAIEACLTGRAPRQSPPLDLSRGSRFQQEVWRALQRIPLGSTWSYARLAREIGSPKAVRAVGGACGANPIPLFVPCHRVLASDGSIGGFSGGLDWKRRLLVAEQCWPPISACALPQALLPLCTN